MVDKNPIEIYKRIPPISKFWFTGTIVLSLICLFGWINPRWLVLDYNLFIQKFQIWRPITGLFFYPITRQTAIHFLIMLRFLYRDSQRLETGIFDGRPADYFFMLIFNWICIVIIAFFVAIKSFLEPMVLSVLAVWCQLNSDEIVQFCGRKFKAIYFPWVFMIFSTILRYTVFMIFNKILGGSGIDVFLGILVGNLYFFLTFKYPQDFGGHSLLRTPKFLYRLLPNRRGGVHGFGIAPKQS